MNKFLVASLSILALLAMPSAAATDAPAPTDLEAEPTDDGVLLSWQPSPDANPDAYRIYVDGTPYTTHQTHLHAPWAATYAVTAPYEDDESAPAWVSGLQASPTWIALEPHINLQCQNFPMGIDPDTPPFVFIGFRESCYIWLWEALGFSPSGLLSKLPASSMWAHPLPDENILKCQNFPMGIDPDTPPFFFIGFQEDCHNWLWEEVGFTPSDLLSEVPLPDVRDLHAPVYFESE